MNQFRLCNRYHKIDHLLSELKKIDPQAEIKIGCQNVCGICRRGPFCIVNQVLVVADTEAELLVKIKNSLH